jgi:hypothetical protein
MLGIDVEYVFSNGREAAGEVAREIRRAKRVELLTGRGNELQRETFSELLGNRPENKTVPFRILLPNPEEGNVVDWTGQREQEIAAIDKSFGEGILRKQISTTVEFLAPYTLSGWVEVRLYTYPHIGRILLTDRTAFFVPYRADAHGRDCSVTKYRAGGDMYVWLSRLFDQLWTAADPISKDGPKPALGP